MILFVLGLVILLLIALAFLFVPLYRVSAKKQATVVNPQAKINQQIYQQQAQQLEIDYQNKLISEAEYQSLRDELAAGLLNDVSHAEIEQTHVNLKATAPLQKKQAVMFIFVAILFCIIAAGAYFVWGNPNAVVSQLQQKQANTEAQKMLAELKTPQQVIVKLEQAIAANPTDPRGWFLLGRMYMDTQDFTKAEQAFAKANSLEPNDPEIMLNEAQVLFVLNNNHLTPTAKTLLQNIITQDPNNPGVINLLALDAYSSGDYNQAINYWQSLLVNINPDSSTAKALQNAINNAQQKLLAEGKGVVNKAVQLTITVKLAAQLQGRVMPDETVFIYARDASGSPMPRAIIKLWAKNLPVTVNLSDANAMLPTHNLSSATEIVVVARISKTGNAMPQAGDLMGESKAFDIKQGRPVNIVIDHVN